MFFGGTVEGDALIMSEYTFYQVINLETRESSPANKKYFFIGNFDQKFASTRYIRERGFYIDADICRHFKVELLFLYDLRGFLFHYGWHGIMELGLYGRQQKIIYIRRESTQTLTFLLFCCGMILLDQFANFEWELSRKK